MIPRKIQLIKNILKIDWDDNTKSSINADVLRKNCPCAVCTSKPDGSDEMRVSYFTTEELQIVSVAVVGNYAINIIWKDGHNTGIYEFKLLKELSQNETD